MRKELNYCKRGRAGRVIDLSGGGRWYLSLSAPPLDPGAGAGCSVASCIIYLRYFLVHASTGNRGPNNAVV
jgi:hypothetical protein